ncbi:MAG: AAA family ATPase [Acidobacteria bacterium]|nr:AAA family ATPase [Acidobacteriota bacterium]
MFLEHFGLRGNPFGVTADARFLYFGPEHREALSALYLSILEGRGLSALIAQAGMGKTTLLRYLAARLKDRAAVALLSHPYRSRTDLMGDLAKRLRLPSEQSEFQQVAHLQLCLKKLAQQRRKLVLLFDEAQAMSDEALEQVRLLSNLRSTNMNLLEIVIAGQPELDDLFRRPELESFRQRVSVVARIPRFTPEHVQAYVNRRLEVAGRTEPVFDEAAVAAIAKVSGGVPRTINQLCYKALALAWADGETTVGAELIEEASRDMDWTLTAPVPTAAETEEARGTAAARPPERALERPQPIALQRGLRVV